MSTNCMSCRYSQIDHSEGEGYDDGPLMRCHRYPPQVFGSADDAAQSWPNVGPDDWCGEYESDQPEPRPAPEPRRNPSRRSR